MRRTASQISRLSGSMTVLVAAVATRGLWALYCTVHGSLSASGNPLSSGEIANIATNLADHRGFSSPFGIGSTPTAWECPVVPGIYAFLIRLAGGPNIHAAFLIVYLQVMIGGLGAWMYWLLVHRLMRRYPGRFAEWLSPAIAVAVCLWPESVLSVIPLWYFTWQEAALALFLLFAFEWSEQPIARRAVLVGLSGGFLALINVTPIPIILTAILFVAARGRFQPASVRSAALALVCFIAVIVPWLIRNAEVFHSIVPLRSNTGYEIFQGNNAVQCIREPAPAPHPADHGAEFKLYMEMGELRYCRFSFHRALQYIRVHPLQTVHRIVDRVYVTWFTDLTERWIPRNETPWWQNSLMFKLRYLITATLIILAVVTFVWGLIRGRFKLLPYAPMFAAILILLPLPHYFTLADPEYTSTFRMSVAITALCIMALQVGKSKLSLAQ